MKPLRALLLLSPTLLSPAFAANSVMIWPIDPAINPEEKASELWLENRGNSTTMMQGKGSHSALTSEQRCATGFCSHQR